MSDNMPGVKSAEDWMKLWSRQPDGPVPIATTVKTVDLQVALLAARRQGMTDAINHLKLRQLANQESCVAMLETARDNIK